jgi:hypothetical protein
LQFRAAEKLLQRLGVDSNNVLPLPQVILNDPYLALMDRGQYVNPGVPPQSAPDYVLNPLSIFRMARARIPEGHSPESTPGHSSSLHTRPQERIFTDDTSTAEGSTAHSGDGSNEMFGSLDDFGQNLDLFFANDSDFDWHSAEMVVGSNMHGDGLLPWIGTSQMGEFVFDPPQP